MKGHSILSSIKMIVAGDQCERKWRTVKTGALKGLNMRLCVCHCTQKILGLWEREVGIHLGRLTDGIESAIDVGAGVGEYTLYFCAKSSARNVLAVEPSCEAVLELRQHLKRNDSGCADSVTLVTRTVGDGKARGEVSLDGLADSIAMPCLIKIDVDGAELAVLEGAGSLLEHQRSNTRWIVETHSRKLEDQCYQLFLHWGFNVQIVKQAWWRKLIPEKRPVERNRWLIAW